MPIIRLPQGSSPLPNVPAPVLDREKRPTVDNRAVQSAVGEMGAVENRQISGRETDALTAPFRALGAVGESVGRTGSLIGALAEKRIEAQTKVQVSEADDEMSALQTSMASRLDDPKYNAAQLPADFAKGVEQLRTNLANRKDLTPQAREALTLRVNSFEKRTGASMQAASDKAIFSKARQASLKELRVGMVAQDPVRFESELKAAHDAGYLDDGDVELSWLDYKQETRRQENQRRNDLIDSTQSAVASSIGAEGEEKTIAKLNSGELGAGLSPADKEQQIRYARQVAKGQTADYIDGVNNRIITGDIKSVEEIEQLQSPLITPQVKADLKTYFAQRDAQAEAIDQRQNGIKNAVDIRQRIAAYDPAADTDKVGYMQLSRDIRTRAEPSMQGELNNELGQKWGVSRKNETRPEIQKNISETLAQVIFNPKTGLIPWQREVQKRDADGKPMVHKEGDSKGMPVLEQVEDSAARSQALDASTQIEMGMNDFFKANPKATLQDAQKHMQTLFDAPARKSIIEALQSVQAPRSTSAAGQNGVSYPAPKTATLGIRANNWTNVHSSGRNEWQGTTGQLNHDLTDDHVTFISPEYGQRAGALNIINKVESGRQRTIREIIAGTGDGSNAWTGLKEHRPQYAKEVAQNTGIGLDEPLDVRDPDKLLAVLREIVRVENGGVPKDFEQVTRRGIRMAYESKSWASTDGIASR